MSSSGPSVSCRRPRAVDVDLVEVIGRRAALAVGEEDLLAVVVDLRIADAALGIVQQHLQLAGAQVQPAEPAAVAVAAAGSGSLA